MSELNSSLCQLNWLIAKGGLVSEDVVVENAPPESNPVTEPLQIVIPQPETPTKAKTSKGRKVFDSADKPPYSYSQLIRLAIEETEEKKCTLADIYSFITSNFQFYRENRNSSWKNSIRHNLSLNKQFMRVEKNDGDRRGWWVYVDPPAKKPRILKGSPVRVNPIYEQLYFQNKKQEAQNGLNYTPPPDDPYLTQQIHDFTDQELNDFNLFESCDLNSSFRDVYNQIFEKPKVPDDKKEAAQIDWLKISLETAGLDYNDEHELREVDTDKLKVYVYEGFPTDYDSDACTPRTDSSRTSSSDSVQSSTLKPPQDYESDEEFDWNTLV